MLRIVHNLKLIALYSKLAEWNTFSILQRLRIKNKRIRYVPSLRLTITAGIRISGIRHLSILSGYLFHRFLLRVTFFFFFFSNDIR